MKRKALMIGNSRGLKATPLDMLHFTQFLMSYQGGAWTRDEIEPWMDKDVNELLNDVEKIVKDQNDYVIVYYYNSLIMQSSPHVEVLYSTSEHEKAYGSVSGSQYADVMSNLVRARLLYWKALAIQDRYGQFCYSMCELQKDLTTELVKRNIQVPEYRIIGTAEASFPFVTLHLPT